MREQQYKNPQLVTSSIFVTATSPVSDRTGKTHNHICSARWQIYNHLPVIMPDIRGTVIQRRLTTFYIYTANIDN